MRIQGMPNSIRNHETWGYETWSYGSSTVTISTRSRRVREWSNNGGNLRVQMAPGSDGTNATSYTIGSHEDDVMRIQGTPNGIQNHETWGYETWSYGSSTVTISTRSRRVREWSNSDGNLRVRLPAGGR